MSRLRPTVLAGIGAALLCNFWLLEGVLAKRSDPAESWISDLAARSEAFGWRFELLEVASGLAVAGFAALLLRQLGRRSPLIRRGLIALALAGLLIAVGGAAPLSCAEGLAPFCSLDYDALDLLHTSANLAEVVAVTLAFAFVGLGMGELRRRAASGTTLAIGAAWLSLAALAGLLFLTGDDTIKGFCQRGGQLLFGVWLVLLGVWAAYPASRSKSAPSRSFG